MECRSCKTPSRLDGIGSYDAAHTNTQGRSQLENFQESEPLPFPTQQASYETSEVLPEVTPGKNDSDGAWWTHLEMVFLFARGYLF